MTNYEIKPFEITPEFETCWFQAGHHLNLRVKDTGASWLRAELPCFREHLAFALGNQLFFIQIFDVRDQANGWMNLNRLNAAANDANGIACLMPMQRNGKSWEPTVPGWGLIDALDQRPLDPVGQITDEPIEMTQWEIHDFGVQTVKQYLIQNGWIVESWQSDLGVDPSIFAHKDDKLCGFVVRTSNKGPDNGERPENSDSIATQMFQRGWGAKFVGLKVAAADDPFDPRLQHLTRRIMRRSGMMVSRIELEDLVSTKD